jgi:sugar/nucleoside kinase (ribokinase family)
MIRVGCAGILVADTFCGPMPALPRPGQLVAVPGMVNRPGGCAANVAIDLVKQGIAVDIAGRIGNDAAGKMLDDSLRAQQVGTGRLKSTDDRPTSTTVILLVEGEDRRYVHAFGANRAFAASDLDREWLKELRLLYVGGVLAMPGLRMGELRDVLGFCRSRGIITVVDVVVPEGTDVLGQLDPLLPVVDYLLPNEDEAKLLTCRTDPREQIDAFLSRGVGTVVITRGACGAVAGDQSHYWEIGTYSATVLDPSGAGDAFCSGIITGAARAWDMPQTLRYAAALGASATRAIGTTDGVFSAEEAEQFVADHPLDVKREERRRHS